MSEHKKYKHVRRGIGIMLQKLTRIEIMQTQQSLKIEEVLNSKALVKASALEEDEAQAEEEARLNILQQEGG